MYLQHCLGCPRFFVQLMVDPALRDRLDIQVLIVLLVRVCFSLSLSLPQPLMFEFAESILPKGAYLRSWIYIAETELLVYNVGGNRYCHNIGREHKSNHTMMVADISRGVCYQRCHDPDCRAKDYSGPRIDLPVTTVYPDLEPELHALTIPDLRSLMMG